MSAMTVTGNITVHLLVCCRFDFGLSSTEYKYVEIQHSSFYKYVRTSTVSGTLWLRVVGLQRSEKEHQSYPAHLLVCMIIKNEGYRALAAINFGACIFDIHRMCRKKSWCGCQ